MYFIKNTRMSITQEQSIFAIKCKSCEQIKIECVAKAKCEERVLDEFLECSNEKDPRILTYIEDMYIRFYRCSITDKYLETHSVLPVMYGEVSYYNSIMSAKLYNVFLEFKITDDIKTAKELIGPRINGKYRLNINGTTQDFEFRSQTQTIEYIKEYLFKDEVKREITKIKNNKLQEKKETMGYTADMYNYAEDYVEKIQKNKIKYNDLLDKYMKETEEQDE